MTLNEQRNHQHVFRVQGTHRSLQVDTLSNIMSLTSFNRKLGISQLHLPVVDHTEPSVQVSPFTLHDTELHRTCKKQSDSLNMSPLTGIKCLSIVELVMEEGIYRSSIRSL